MIRSTEETHELMALELRPQGLKGVNHMKSVGRGVGVTGTASTKALRRECVWCVGKQKEDPWSWRGLMERETRRR